MSLRRVCTRAPHTTRTAMSQSWSRPTHLRVQIPYRDARLGSQKEKQQHSSKAYSNFVPKGPSQYCGAYGQPPKSRASRLKDMAIGSALTFAISFAYIFFYDSQQLQEAEEDVKRANELRQIHSRYKKIRAETDDDGGSESSEETNRERGSTVVPVENGQGDTFELEYVGSLPRFPEGHEKHGSEIVKDGETSVFLLSPANEEELATIEPKDIARTIARVMIIKIEYTAENLGIENPNSSSNRGNDQTYTKFFEITWRAAMMIEDMFQCGTLDSDRPTLLEFHFLDGSRSYVWDPLERRLMRIRQDQIRRI
ncbi:hypothetical protein F4679DRAFT_112736 [Xylaria curta]|nr:hypothetical protein F4679DRAFT_112736 [Xylaria curta]